MGHYGPQCDPPFEQMPLALPAPWPRAGYGGPLQGLRIGVYDEWFNDAAPGVVAACRAALAAAEAAGAAVESLVVPELEELRVAHTVTIVSEMLHNFRVSRVMRFVVAANMLGLPALSLPVGWVPEEEGGGAPATTNRPAAVVAPLAGGDAKAGAVGKATVEAVAAAPPADGRLLLPAGLQLIGRPMQEATLLRVGAVLEAALAKGAAMAGGGGPKRAHLNPVSSERRGL
ncbi:hypothetical protein TSOC_005059 [Tetrabaena socialis]|uniref:Amidase domain-containing protein n=1 Tax=Tetrabaena socialis TaxID=47790 RepID=A0A2J8A7I8_9CHLO|nr:hypothetical protein TSOC_005059 [Tetrabaena socialis]|eukprot:PNH08477.1 hypothetical protein TSOC_005059 [Tetrabaena socialis]